MSEIVRDEFPRRNNTAMPDNAQPSVDAASLVGSARLRPLKSVQPTDTVPRSYDGSTEIATDLERQLLQADERLEGLREQVAGLELRLREQLEIVRMRNLELGRLEGELEYKSQRLATVETELFHEHRRSAELERRWNDLAMRYEEVASRLVETGATLQQISTQRSYRTIVRIVQVLRRHRGTDALLDHATRREHPEPAR